MKKLLVALLLFSGMSLIAPTNAVQAQDDSTSVEDSTLTDEQKAAQEAFEAEMNAPADEGEMEEAVPVTKTEESTKAKPSGHQRLKQLFIDGGAEFMGIVLICLILGLALCIERIIYLNLSSTNTNKLLESIEDALNSGGVDAAKEVCRNTKGPIASIFYQGLDRSSEGVEMVEKTVISYGGVQMGLLEKGLSWISLFIALAPMLGFMGTVIGMIDAFESIAEANNISPAIVADGIKVALLTTVFGLITAIILQIFYNYIVSKIDAIVHQMEDASISMVDILIKKQVNK